MSPRASALRSAGSIVDSGKPVRSTNHAVVNPSRSRSALSMNSNASASRATSCSLLIALPARACSR